jgi:hypothetical protein
MNTDALFLFLILLLGLVFCSVLGGNCGAEGFDSGNADSMSTNNSTSTNGASTSGAVNYDNYNHYSGSSTQLANGTTFYGNNGGYVVVSSNQDGSQGLRVVVAGGAKPISFSSQSQSMQDQQMQSQPMQGQSMQGQSMQSQSMQSQSMQGQPMQSQSNASDNSSATFYGPNGALATVTMNANGQQSIQVQTASGSYDFSSGYGQPDSNAVSTSSDSVTSTQYYGSTGSPVQLSGYSLAYQGTGGSANPSTMSSQSTMSAPPAYDYSSSLPQGIPASQIPRGQEDMYILKSEIVPPVCPACPTSAACPRQEKCPPCPACARCPEPSFECKKVPNYSAINNDYLPSPVLNDFSSFGM